jgi:hypothetical protein
MTPAEKAKDTAEINDNRQFRKAELAGHAVQGKIRQPGDKSPPDKPRTTMRFKGGASDKTRKQAIDRLSKVKI